MKERPILFSGRMVPAILEGKKTQTRRVMKDQSTHSAWLTCPYGATGDRLWVRETFALENTHEYHGDHKTPTDGRPIKKYDDPDGSFWLIPHYRATEPEPHIVSYSAVLKHDNDDATRWTPSIHMPRWASRLTLEITGIRVERLQDIPAADCHAEGVQVLSGEDALHQPGQSKLDDAIYRDAFARLWESINGSGSWALNPWVWVIAFKRIKGEG